VIQRGRLGKQLYRLPNICLDVITDVGLDEASPAYRTVIPNPASSGEESVFLCNETVTVGPVAKLPDNLYLREPMSGSFATGPAKASIGG
jgi:hypothetical protein